MKARLVLAITLAWCASASCFAQYEPTQSFGPMLGQLQLAQQRTTAPTFFYASESQSVRTALRGYEASIENHCARRARAGHAKAGQTDTITELQQETMCACYPEKTRALLTRVGPWKLDPQLAGNARFATVAVNGVVRPCAAEKLALLFEGDSCPGFDATNSRGRTSQPAFCSCMKNELDAWTDVEMQDAGMELLRFNDTWRYAKVGAAPADPLIDRYRHTLAKCRGGSGT